MTNCYNIESVEYCIIFFFRIGTAFLEINMEPIVHFTGRVTYATAQNSVIFCALNMTLFPFDVQTCGLVYGSINFLDVSVNLINSTNVFLGRASEGDGSKLNSQFEISSFAFTPAHQTDGNPDVYPIVYLRLILKRYPAFYVLNIMAPSMFLAACAMLAYCLPVTSGR